MTYIKITVTLIIAYLIFLHALIINIGNTNNFLIAGLYNKDCQYIMVSNDILKCVKEEHK